MPPSSERKTISSSSPRERRNGLGALGGVAVGDQRQRGRSPAGGSAARSAPGRSRRGRGARTGRRGRGRARRRVVVLDHEREVELAPLEQPEQLLVVAGLDEPHLDARPALDVAAHRLGEEPHAGALERSDPQRARLSFGERPQVGLGRAHRRRGPARVAEQPLPRLGGVTGFLPPGRSSNGRPAARSSVAICWLIADCE